MRIKDYIRKHFLNKSFRVYIDDQPCRFNVKNYTPPSSIVMCTAIEKHVATTGESLEFIQREKPITFLLDREKYKAELVSIGTPFLRAYRINCTNWVD